MPRIVIRELCPVCKENLKNVRSHTCVYCCRKDFAKHNNGRPIRGNYNRPAGFIVTDRSEADLIRPLMGVESDPAWRPPHYPPPCEGCGGFGYITSSRCNSACDKCKDHPGHAMSFAEWDKIRP